MLNMFTVLGRVTEIGNDTIDISVPDADDKTENFNIHIEIGFNMAKQIKEYCHIGDLVGVKGKIIYNNILVGEKVTALSSRKNND